MTQVFALDTLTLLLLSLRAQMETSTFKTKVEKSLTLGVMALSRTQ